MPCLNEEETLGICIDKALQAIGISQIEGEVIIADNGSSDNSVAVAKEMGARVISVSEKGYGAALQGGIIAAKGKYIIMGDADDSYDFLNLEPFIEQLKQGAQLVMGNRFKGGIAKGAMPFLHRYLGNPVLSFIGRLFFNSKMGDFHCGLRGFTKEAYEQMQLKSSGMEFASEMVVKATLLNMNIAEVPTTLSPDGRSRAPHLNTWRDGWRHLRFLLLYSPKWLLLVPGMLMLIIGAVLGGSIYMAPLVIGNVHFDIHTMVYMMTAALIGCQLLLFFVMVKNYVHMHKLFPIVKNQKSWIYTIPLERGILMGGLIFLIGIVLSISNYYNWSTSNFGTMNPGSLMRSIIPAVFCLFNGLQVIIASFVLTLIRQK